MFWPILNGAEQVAYKEWFLHFCVSLSWRVLLFVKNSNANNEYSPEQDELALAAEKTWREFLRGQHRHPGKFEQHVMVFTQVGGNPSSAIPKNINRYLLGGVEMDIFGSENSMMTFAKIGRFAYFGVIQRPSGKWENTKVRVREGVIKPGKFRAPSAIGSFFLDRARKVESVLNEGMSPTQKQKAQKALNDAIMRDPSAFLASDHGIAMIADANMFGEDAILFKP